MKDCGLSLIMLAVCWLTACSSGPRYTIPTLRIALQQVVAADESATGLPQTSIGDTVELDLET